MRKLRFGKGTRIVAALAAGLGAVAFGSLAGSSSAHADPAWGTNSLPLVMVGSNTIEDLGDALSGVAPTPGIGTAANLHEFTPLYDNGNATLGNPATFEQVYSWDAVNQSTNAEDCISAKPGFAPIARPNGSGDGKIAISDAIAGVSWNKATNPAGCVGNDPAGQIDIGRSSSPPAGGACTFVAPRPNCLVWVDIAHDAVSYAYDIVSGSATTAQVSELTLAGLQSLYSNTTTGTYTDPATNVTYAACLPQLGSGTEKFWVNNILATGDAAFSGTAGITLAENAATAAHCINFEENGALTLATTASAAIAADAADSPAPTVGITPFSVGSWISQLNGFAFNRSAPLPTGIGMGSVNNNAADGGQFGTALPYTGAIVAGGGPGSGTSLAPNATFTTTSPYGRDLYVEMNNLSLNGKAATLSGPLQDMFGSFQDNYGGASGTTDISDATTSAAQVCQAPYDTTDLTEFGFTAPSATDGAPNAGPCGNETLTLLTTGTGA
jgi:hypothetical protein